MRRNSSSTALSKLELVVLAALPHRSLRPPCATFEDKLLLCTHAVAIAIVPPDECVPLPGSQLQLCHLTVCVAGSATAKRDEADRAEGHFMPSCHGIR
jgi:hypothetical protein